MATKRITYTKVTNESDYADARFDVLLDGEKIGQVVKFTEAGGRSAGGRTYLTSTWTKMVWAFEGGTYPNGRPYQQFDSSKTRVDAVVDYLMHGRNMNYDVACETAGKRGL